MDWKAEKENGRKNVRRIGEKVLLVEVWIRSLANIVVLSNRRIHERMEMEMEIQKSKLELPQVFNLYQELVLKVGVWIKSAQTLKYPSGLFSHGIYHFH